MTRTRSSAVPVVLVALAAWLAGSTPVFASWAGAAPRTSAGAPLSVQRAVVQQAPVLQPAVAERGQTVKVKGRLGTRVSRQVVLQRKTGSTWRRVAGAKTDPTGRYRITYAAPGATTRLRVKAPAFDRRGRHFRQLVTAAATLKVQEPPAPTAQLDLPEEALGAGPPADAVVRTTHVAVGTPVTVQRRTGATWHDVAASSVDASGVARIPLPLGDLGTGTASVRAVVPGLGPTPADAIEVHAPGTIIEPVDDEALSGSFDVRVDVEPALTPTRVQLYVDGFVMPDAQPASQPVPGQPQWTATIDPSAVALNRRHVDVVARVTTGDGSALTRPVRVDLLPSTGGVPAGFRVDTVVSGFNQPTSFAPIDEHRVLVAEKAGLVRLAVDGVVRSTPVLDLRDLVDDVVDTGMLDVALDPDFEENGWFYVAYVAEDSGGTLVRTQRVVRYTLVGDVAQPASAHVVLGGVPRAACEADQSTPGCLLNRNAAHTIDDLLFASDGSLFVSVGDGANGDPERALLVQDLDVLNGKILRVDPETGLGLPSNPYYDAGEPAANRGRVWAYGFRNPFRMAFSPQGDLYVGDVGEFKWEEVDEVVAGGNYGWPCFEGTSEGTTPDAPECGAIVHREPLLTYGHVDFAGSVTLGVFTDGDAYPDEYAGLLFLGDYTQGRVWTLDVDPPVGDPELEDFGIPPGIGAGVAYDLGPDGTIWYADIASGSIRRIGHDLAGDACPSGQYLAETFRNRDFDPEPDGDPWVSSCVGTPPPGPGLLAPGSPNQGEGWSMRWSGSPQLAPGTYRLTAKADGTLKVRVGGELVPDGGMFTVSGADVNESTADVVVELQNYPPFDHEPFFVDFDWRYELSWERVGTAPAVTLHDVGQGGRVDPGSTVGWAVTATDAEDGDLGADDVRVDVTLLHYGTGSPHRHPGASVDGFSGSTVVDDDHAHGKIAYRLVGVAIDSSGWVAESDPVYVCLVDNLVGPCG